MCQIHRLCYEMFDHHIVLHLMVLQICGLIFLLLRYVYRLFSAMSMPFQTIEKYTTGRLVCARNLLLIHRKLLNFCWALTSASTLLIYYHTSQVLFMKPDLKKVDMGQSFHAADVASAFPCVWSRMLYSYGWFAAIYSGQSLCLGREVELVLWAVMEFNRWKEFFSSAGRLLYRQ